MGRGWARDLRHFSRVFGLVVRGTAFVHIAHVCLTTHVPSVLALGTADCTHRKEYLQHTSVHNLTNLSYCIYNLVKLTHIMFAQFSRYSRFSDAAPPDQDNMRRPNKARHPGKGS